MADPAGAVEKIEEFGDDDKAVVARWLAEIAAYDKKFENWTTTSKKIIERYRNEKDNKADTADCYNVLWSNVRTLQPALYSRQPEPNVTRRFRDKDPIGRAAATIIERALSYCTDEYDFDGEIKAARDDYLLTGRGQAWLRYIPTYGDETTDRIPVQDVDGKYVDEDGEEYDEAEPDDEGLWATSEPYKPVLDESVVTEYVDWCDFGHSVAPRWTLVNAVWRRSQLSRGQLVDRFGKKVGNAVPLNVVVAGEKEDAEKHGGVFKRARIYEIWDKVSRKVYWICPDYKEGPLDVKDDPLRLESFFPCPKPLYDTMTGGTLVPVPEYTEYHSQAKQIDELTARIALLTEAMRVAGVYDAQSASVEELLSNKLENKLVAVSNWAMFAEKGGLKGAVDFLPLADIATVLQALYVARDQQKRDLQELTGLSDIVRGQGDPNETAAAQKIKGRYAGMRLEDRQDEVSRFVRDILRIKGEIIAEHFSPEKIAQISDYEETTGADAVTFQQAVEMLRDDGMRSYRLDFETDATVAVDQDAEKQSRIEFLGAVTPFIREAVQASEAMPQIAPVLSEMLMFVVRGFKTGRDIEGSIEDALQAAGQQQQKEDPAQQTEAVKMQLAGQQLQLDERRVALDERKAALEDRRKMAEIQGRQQVDAAGLEIEREELALKQDEAAMDFEVKSRQLDLDAQQAEFSAFTAGEDAALEREKLEKDDERG